MPIEGPLRELGLADLLQLIHLSRKTGVLTVRTGRFKHTAHLEFDRGAAVGARASGEAPRLGQLLVASGKATQGQVDRALAAQRADPRRRLGAILVEREGVPRDEVERQLRFQLEETVFELVRWTDGDVRFEEAEVSDPGPVALRVSTEGLLMESMRRMDEWSALASAAPDTDLVPGLVESTDGERGLLALEPGEWEVLAAVDGERSLRAIARALGRGDFDVAKAVFSLVDAGVVALGHRRPQQPEQASGGASGTGSEAERQARLGERHARVGEWARAVASLRKAVEMDPLLARAYYALGRASARTGDLAGARQAFDTYLRLPDASGPHRDRARRASALLAEMQQLLEEEGA